MHGIYQMSSKTPIRGFTLIEIMIVVAVIGILAAIALPAYQDYTVRSKVSEGLGFASAAKIAVVSAYSNKSLPLNNAEAGLPEPEQINSQYVKEVTINKQDVDEGRGDIWVTFNDVIPQLSGKSLVLAATERGGAIDWCCYSDDIEPRYMPASCRGSEKCGSAAPTPSEEEKVANCKPVKSGRPSCKRENMDIGCPAGWTPRQNATSETPTCVGRL